MCPLTVRSQDFSNVHGVILFLLLCSRLKVIIQCIIPLHKILIFLMALEAFLQSDTESKVLNLIRENSKIGNSELRLLFKFVINPKRTVKLGAIVFCAERNVNKYV